MVRLELMTLAYVKPMSLRRYLQRTLRRQAVRRRTSEKGVDGQ
jgi:hypothetical protein